MSVPGQKQQVSWKGCTFTCMYIYSQDYETNIQLPGSTVCRGTEEHVFLCRLGELNPQQAAPSGAFQNQMQFLSFAFNHWHQNRWIRNHYKPFSHRRESKYGLESRIQVRTLWCQQV